MRIFSTISQIFDKVEEDCSVNHSTNGKKKTLKPESKVLCKRALSPNFNPFDRTEQLIS